MDTAFDPTLAAPQAPAQSAQQTTHARPMPRRLQWPGIGHVFDVLWNGAARKPEDVKYKDHAGWARSIGRKIAVPLMFLFSIGALIKLSKDQLQVYIGWLATGKYNLLAQNAVGITVLFVILFLVFSMDIVMIVCCVDWIDKKANSQNYIKEALIVLFVSVAESITFTMLLADQEHPKNTEDWLLILMRSCAVPVVTTTLATFGDKVITEKERLNMQKAKADNAIAASMDQVVMQPSVANLPMLIAYRRSLDIDVDPAVQARREAADAKHIENIQRLMPGAIESAARQEVDNLKKQLDAQRQAIMSEAQAFISSAMSNFIPWFVHAIEHNVWPDELLEHSPAFATTGLEPMVFLKKAGIKTGGNNMRRADPAAADTIENALIAIGCDPTKHFAQKSKERKGLWVTSQAIPIISNGAIPATQATPLAKDLGDSKKQGTSNIAPIKALMNELTRRNQLHPDLVSWQKRNASEAASDDDTADVEGQESIELSV